LSQPHVPTGELFDAIRNDGIDQAEIDKTAKKIFDTFFDRIGDEELWLFKKKIKGEKDIGNLELNDCARSYLFGAWHNRLLLEYEKGKYSPVWHYQSSRAYQSLSAEEKENVESLLQKCLVKSEKTWETHGAKLLSILVASSSMLPCAEDLGAVPDCVPKVLAKLNILGLRVLRWHMQWFAENQPYIPFEQYPELSVCTPAVHDSSTVREWWEREVDQGQLADFLGFPSLPKVYNPGTAKIILTKTASAASTFRIFQIQDLLHLSNKWYSQDPASERINIPGTTNEFNWTYRLPASIEEIGKDSWLVSTVAELSKAKAAKKQGN
jgi:4-alpha-glucanotransferase